MEEGEVVNIIKKWLERENPRSREVDEPQVHACIGI